MTIEWRGVPAGDVDHERLWGSVIAVAIVTAGAAIHAVGVPPLGCVFKAAAGLPCPTCGFTRALLALAAGDLVASLRWNPLVPLAAAAAVCYFAYAVTVVAAGSRRLRASFTHAEGQAARWSTVVAVALVWAWLIVDGR